MKPFLSFLISISSLTDQLEYGLIGDDNDIVFLDENPRTAFWDIGFSKKRNQEKDGKNILK
jgi:hypothetical protein